MTTDTEHVPTQDLQAALRALGRAAEHPFGSHLSQAEAHALLVETLSTLMKVDQRATDARNGSMVDGEPEYEAGWLAAAEYIYGVAK